MSYPLSAHGIAGPARLGSLFGRTIRARSEQERQRVRERERGRIVEHKGWLDNPHGSSQQQFIVSVRRFTYTLITTVLLFILVCSNI